MNENIVVILDFDNLEAIADGEWIIHTAYFLNRKEKIKIYILKEIATQSEEKIKFNVNKALAIIDGSLKKNDEMGNVYFVTQREDDIEILSKYIDFLKENKRGEISLAEDEDKKVTIEKIQDYHVVKASFEAMLTPIHVKSEVYREKYKKLEEHLRSKGITLIDYLLPK